MKATLFIVILSGAAMVAGAADPTVETASPDANPPSAPADLAVVKDPAAPAAGLTLDAADRAYDARIGREIALAGAITQTKPHAAARTFAGSLNPFAPMPPQPETPWASRAAWTTVADHAAAGSAGFVPVEVRHESRLGVTVASW